MIQTLVKENEECYCLYVNLTQLYISFKIEQGKFLGSAKDLNKNCEDYLVVEHGDTVNYLLPADIHKTEKDAYKALIKMLQKKINKENNYER